MNEIALLYIGQNYRYFFKEFLKSTAFNPRDVLLGELKTLEP